MKQLASGWLFSLFLLSSRFGHASLIAGLERDRADTATMLYDGDLLLGALLPLRTRETETKQVCGAVQLAQGLQTLETLIFTLDWLNNASVSPVKLPFRLGAIVYDCCQNAQVAIENTINLFMPFSSTFAMRRELVSTAIVDANVTRKLVGLIGAADSEVSVSVASILSPLKIPQISFLSTSRDLSNKEKFKYFARTVPANTNAAKAIVKLLKSFNWSVVSVVYDDSNYGLRAFADFEKVAGKNEICFSIRRRLPGNERNLNDYEEAIEGIIRQKQARVVVMYLSTGSLNEFLRAARKYRSQLSHIVWIGTDSWFNCDELYNEASRLVTNRSIVLTPRVRNLPAGYEAHWNTVNPLSNESTKSRNPWLLEYLENRCNCSFNSSWRFQPYSPANLQRSCVEIERDCLEKVWRNRGIRPQLHHIVEATLAFAYSLKKLHDTECRSHSQSDLCKEIRPERLERQRLMKLLREIEFPYDGRVFRFDNGIDGPSEYSIMLLNGSLWTFGGFASNNAFNVTEQLLNSPLLRTVSRCDRCGVRQMRWMVEGTCCWSCVNCSASQIVERAVNWSTLTLHPNRLIADRCASCADGWYVDNGTNRCVRYQEVTIGYSSWQAIPVLIFCALGIVFTGLTIACFCKYWQTPVVKACGRETCVFLLVSAALSYSAPLLIVSRPDALVCLVTRCSAGLCQTLAYSAMFTKALRIAVIFRARQAQSSAAKYCTVKFQAYAILTLIGAELLIVLVWSVYEPSQLRDHYDPTHRTFESVCSEIAKTYTAMLVLPACILVVAAVFAFRIRKTPDGFNDAKSLGFVIYTNCALMVAVMPALVSANFAYKLRIISLCILMHFSASSILYGLLLPKVYICVFRPEKNTRQAVMNRSRTFNNVSTVATPRSSRNFGASPSQASASAPAPVGAESSSAYRSTVLSCFCLSNVGKKAAELESRCNSHSRRDAPLRHRDRCSCRCDCCVNWENEMETSRNTRRKYKLPYTNNVHFEVFDDDAESIGCKQTTPPTPVASATMQDSSFTNEKSTETSHVKSPPLTQSLSIL